MADYQLALEKKIKDRSAVIGIVGLGYVGLPLALAFARAGFRVLGFDVQQKRVDMLNQGQSYIADADPKALAAAIAAKNLAATTDQSRTGETDAICICVPTPLTPTKAPDLSYIISESEAIQKHLRPGQLIVLESTTYPGTTREVVLPILERSGLKAGVDFFLGFSPERVDPGSKKYQLKNTPKVVSGIDPESASLIGLLYGRVADVIVPVSSPEVAEMTKVFENVFRNVNIALVNELALLCEKMGISVWEVIDAAATKPFGYTPFYPGPGIGGHCIPLDPYYLADKAREYDFHTRFIELAAGVNENMPYYVVSRVVDALNARGKSIKDAMVIVMGVAYKKDIDDVRESPSLKLIELLAKKGARVFYNDPYVPKVKVAGHSYESLELTDEQISQADCLLIATDHTVYDFGGIAQKAKFIFDARGVTRKLKGDNIVRL